MPVVIKVPAPLLRVGIVSEPPEPIAIVVVLVERGPATNSQSNKVTTINLHKVKARE